MTAYTWQLLILAIIAVESPKTPQQAQAAIAREGAHGCMQIRQICLTDVNRFRRTSYTLKDVEHSSEISRWVFVQYALMYGHDTPETIARAWNGGPRGHLKKATVSYWEKVQKQMAIIQARIAFQRVKELHQ